MLLVLVILFFYREPKLLIKPTSIGANLIYINQSQLPEMFEDLRGLKTRERDHRIEKMGLRYGLGGVQGRNGLHHLAVVIERGDSETF